MLAIGVVPAAPAGERDGPTSAPATGARAYSLEEAILMALERNLEIQVERRAPQIRDERIVGALAEFDPSLNFRILYEDLEREQNTREFVATDNISVFTEENLLFQTSLTGKVPFGTSYEIVMNSDSLENSLNDREVSRFRPEYDSDLALTITQPLLRDFGTEINRTQVRLAMSDRKISELDLRAKVLEVVAAVMDAYVETIFGQENVAVKQDAIELAQSLKKENERRVELGVMKPIDVIQADAAVAEAEEAMIVAETFLFQRRNTLKSLIFEDFEAVSGLRVEAADRLQVDVPNVGDRTEWIVRALANNPEFLKQRETASQEDIRYRFARNQTLPRLDFQTTLGYNGLDGDYWGSFESFRERTGPEFTAGFVFSYPLGNRRAKSVLKESEIRREQAAMSVQFTQNSVAAAVDSAIEEVKANGRRLEATGKSVELAREALDAELKRLETGVGTSYDLRRAQEELSNARTRSLGALAELRKSITALWRVSGFIPELERHFQFDFSQAGE